MKKFLFAISFLVILLLPSDTFATRVDVDVNHLTNYFDYSPSGGFYDGGASITSSSKIMRLTSSTRSDLNCSNSVFYSYVLFNNPFSFTPVSQSVGGFDLNYISGDYSNGVVYSYNRDAWIGVFSGDSAISQSVTFDKLIIGCSAEEVASASPTPTPTPTPTATPTPTPTEEPSPTPTPEEIDPSEYEYNAVEDSIIKYRFISWIIISVAGYLIYKLIIKRIIIR